MSSYLEKRSQYVQVETKKSDKLEVGPRSVIQGSCMSTILFLIFILDLPEIYHIEKHNPIENTKCKETKAKTFVDDTYLEVQPKDNQTMETSCYLKCRKNRKNICLPINWHLTQINLR